MTLFMIFTVLTLTTAVVLGVWQYIIKNKAGYRGPSWLKNLQAQEKRNILIVIAHPDDECMFFSPTILALTRLKHKVFVLCLSTGDYYNMGGQRQKELYDSCNMLNIPQEQVSVVNDSVLQDDPTMQWDRPTVARYIAEKVQEHSINTVITFDEYGVSGHPNHRSLYHATRQVLKNASGALTAYSLISVAWYQKYTSLLAVLWCWHQGDLLFVSSGIEIRQSQRAMLAHWSQFVWFRALYITFSQYMAINTLNSMDCNTDKTQ